MPPALRSKITGEKKNTSRLHKDYPLACYYMPKLIDIHSLIWFWWARRVTYIFELMWCWYRREKKRLDIDSRLTLKIHQLTFSLPAFYHISQHTYYRIDAQASRSNLIGSWDGAYSRLVREIAMRICLPYKPRRYHHLHAAYRLPRQPREKWDEVLAPSTASWVKRDADII